MLSVHTLGGFYARSDGRLLCRSIGDLCCEIFVYLLINGNRPQRREKLTDLFYRDEDGARSANALSSMLWRIKSWLARNGVAGEIEIVSSKYDVALCMESGDLLDVARFQQTRCHPCLSPGNIAQVERAVGEYGGAFMDGLDSDWVLIERERLHCLYVESLQRMIAYYGQSGDFEKAIGCGRRILDVDPLREYIHRALILLYAVNGQRAAALKQYDDCRLLLDREIGMAPIAETTDLIADIRNGTPVSAAALGSRFPVPSRDPS